jgi:hypothetical protein
VDAIDRLVVPAVAAFGVAAASPLLWLWPDDGIIDAWTVGLALWQAMPFALLLVLRRMRMSAVGTVATALGIAVLTTLGYVAVERDDSSTAGIALLFFPIYLAALSVVAFLIDLGARHIARRFNSRSAGAR